jgi:multidrug efflux pump subunit AcrB
MSGLIRWFTINDVAANLLMLLIILAGLYSYPKIPMEILPRFDTDSIGIRVTYEGATPTEMEENVVIRIEQEIQDIEGIKHIRSAAMEGVGDVEIEVLPGYDEREMMEDIKSRIDNIETFPEEMVRPTVSINQRNIDVISVVVAGELSERELRQIAEKVAVDLRSKPEISQVELVGARNYEISIEISEQSLKRYGLTFKQIGDAIKRSSVDIPAGQIRTKGGDILLSTPGLAHSKEDFAKIVILTDEHGTRLTLGEIAEIKDGFAEGQVISRYQGKSALMLDITRVSNENAIHIAETVKQYVLEAQEQFPPTVSISYWRDRSKSIKGRIGLLFNNAIQGGILVFLLLTLFLRLKIAFWVCIGIPVSFFGVIALMPTLGVSINLVSTFAFIVVLGIIVDDAIVTGESIATHQNASSNPLEATISGVKEVAMPVTFGVMTTVVAFLPLLAIEGNRGKIFAPIALVVVPALLFSLLETKLILPAHLKHIKPVTPDNENNWLNRIQNGCSFYLSKFINETYKPFLAKIISQRYLTVSMFLGLAMILLSLVASGRMGFTFFPRVESEVATAAVVFPVGTPFEITERHTRKIAEAAYKLQEKYSSKDAENKVIKAVYSVAGHPSWQGIPRPHVGKVRFEVMPPELREPYISVGQLTKEWRDLIGIIPGVEELNFRSEIGHRNPIDIQIQSDNLQQLSQLAVEIKQRLSNFGGIDDIYDNSDAGKQEIRLAIKPQAELLGLTLQDLATQVRQAFYGLEVQRIQRNKEDVKVMLRYPLEKRTSLSNLESMLIRTSTGIEVPFTDVAEIEHGRSNTTIQRVNSHRSLNIKADINKEKGNAGLIEKEIEIFMRELLVKYPDVQYSQEGEAREQQESFRSLLLGGIFIAVCIYALLAIPFKSYFQPLVVMFVIPFGLIGAILGHLIMNVNLSISSLLGMLALSGVVINDSLVLIDRFNQLRQTGRGVVDAIIQAGCNRFRAILLTSLTTFAGLLPLIFEKGTQAQFLIPMAVSLGYGILFATLITLVLVPAISVILEDMRMGSRWVKNRILQ